MGQNILTLLKDINEEVSEALSSIRDDIKKLPVEIVKSVDMASGEVENIAAVSEELTASIEQITANIDSISKSSENTIKQIESEKNEI